jgi:four helix bundle protein
MADWNFRDLEVWREAMDLAVEVYQGTERFPRDQLYSLTQQIQKCAVSVPSNICRGPREEDRSTI